MASGPRSPAAIFTRLGMRFRHLQQVEALEEDSDRIEKLMNMAGKQLHESIVQHRLKVVTIPEWLSALPEHPVMRTARDGSVNECVATHWATYWWHAVLWLQAAMPDASIILPRHPIARVRKQLLWGEFKDEILPLTLDLFPRRAALTGIWGQIAAASADACECLSIVLREEFSKPLQKKEIAERFGVSIKTLNKRYIERLKPINRQSFLVRLHMCTDQEREAFES